MVLPIQNQTPENFHVVADRAGLPAGPKQITNVYQETSREAAQYAHQHPDRRIYWIRSQKMAVWVTPLRREKNGLG
jgi:hypothetical protein